MAKKSVPIIDMQSINVGAKIVKAWEECGCFINHGVPIELMSEMKGVARSLTDLPMDIKHRNTDPHHPTKGYPPPNVGGPCFEGLSLYDRASPGAVEHFCSQLQASPHQREVLNKYASALYDLAQCLGRKLMEEMGVDDDELFKNWACQLKLNKFNFRPQTLGLTGAVMHTDPGFLTILQDDEIVNGLEIVDKITGELVPVDPAPGTLVANLGDVAEVWGNGRFCISKHRVQCYQPTVRTFIAFFALAPRDGRVETPPQMVDSDHPRRYVPFDFEEYRKLRISTASPTGEALQYFLAKSC